MGYAADIADRPDAAAGGIETARGTHGETETQSRASGRRRAPTAPGPDYDSPWKEALDRYFERCLAFFFPQAHAEIDWARGYEMLDKELQPIVRRAGRGRRYVDKLVKVWLKDGEERWLLIHSVMWTFPWSATRLHRERGAGWRDRTRHPSGSGPGPIPQLSVPLPAGRPPRSGRSEGPTQKDHPGSTKADKFFCD